MNPRLAAASLLPVLALAGAVPPSPQQYEFRCRLRRTDGTELASPTATAPERVPCTFNAGGTAPTLRRGVTLNYGQSLTAWAAPAADGKVLLDLTLSTTTVDADGPDGVTVSGSTVHTVRTVHPGQPAHMAVGANPEMTLDVVVYERAR